MRRALVLGGGGPLGVGWEAGFLAGLADARCGARRRRSGRRHLGRLDRGRAAHLRPAVGRPGRVGLGGATLGGRRRRGRAAGPGRDAGRARRRGHRVRGGLGGALRLPRRGRLAGELPLHRFDLEAGQFALWDRASGVELPRAVASSCTVPGLAPPVTIADGHYIDGGARDMLNADLAVGHDVVVTLSCVALEPPDDAVPGLLAGLLPAVASGSMSSARPGAWSRWSNLPKRSSG